MVGFTEDEAKRMAEMEYVNLEMMNRQEQETASGSKQVEAQEV